MDKRISEILHPCGKSFICEEKWRSAITSLHERPPTCLGQSGPVMNFGKHRLQKALDSLLFACHRILRRSLGSLREDRITLRSTIFVLYHLFVSVSSSHIPDSKPGRKFGSVILLYHQDRYFEMIKADFSVYVSYFKCRIFYNIYMYIYFFKYIFKYIYICIYF